MAININPGTPLRQVASFNSSGNFTPPAGTNIVFVSIHGASGGGAGGAYTNNLPAGSRAQDGGAGLIASAFIQVVPSVSVPVVVGAAGVGGAMSNNFGQVGQSGTSAGNSSFDSSALFVSGGQGGNANISMRYSGAATGSSASGTTSLSTVSPSGALTRTATIATQNSGAHGVGSGGQVNSRYSGANSGSSGGAGQVNIYA